MIETLGILACWAALAAGAADAPASPYRLELACRQQRLLLGEQVECALEIEGYSLAPPAAGALADRPGLAFRPGPAGGGKATGFVYPFDFRPDEAGTVALGPFELSFEGHRLTSNRLALQVIAPPPGDVMLAIVASASEVRVGEPFDLVLIERVATEPGQRNTPPARVALVGNRRLEIRGGTRTTRIRGDGVEHVTFYQAVASEPGALVIDADFLAGLEPEEEVPEVVVDVRD